jgi:two-component system, OmpR family, sensor kinase
MNMANRVACAFILCDAQGVIEECLHDNFGLAGCAPGRQFGALVDSDSLGKAQAFVDALKADGKATDWELNLPLAGRLSTLHFSGTVLGTALIIVVSTTKVSLFESSAGMSPANREPPSPLQFGGASTSPFMGQPAAPDGRLLDEISRLNNDLLTMQRELAQKNAELERLNQEKNRFLGMAAHDLRNPLHAILNHSGLLLAENPSTPGPQYREFLQAVYASSEFMSRLVDDLLDVARIESGQLQLDLSTVDIGALLTTNVTLNRILAAKKSIAIDLHSQPLPPVIVDPAKIDQVLNNLIGNAIEFSAPGSKIDVSLTAVGNDFQIVVRDQGPGIPLPEQAHLFQAFRRGQAKATGGEKNTGLGLMIVKRIVEGHGGRIWLESAAGRGTAFFVAIPLQPQEVSL